MNLGAEETRDECEARVSSAFSGLSQSEAEHRHLVGLGNSFPNGSSRSLWEILRTNVFTLFNAIVFTGFGILLALGRWQDAFFGLPALLNTAIGVFQEYGAKQTLDRLAVLHAPTARVMRDGKISEITLDRVVLGDLLVLRTGDQITADSKVVRADDEGPGALEIDESLLTGESLPVRKRMDAEVLSGSSVVGGSGLAEVIRVGADSYAAKLTAEARKFSLVHSELRASIDRLLKWITWALGPMVLIVVNGQMQAQGGWRIAIDNAQWREAVVGAVAAVIAMVPLGLVLVTSIAFAVSGVALAKRNVLIQELPAVEGLARVNALCVDKTGTLTTGEMRLDQARVLQEVPGWQRVLGYIGDSPEANGTARCLAKPFGGAAEQLAPVREVPFDSVRKWSAVVFGEETKHAILAPGTWVLGAPDVVLAGVSNRSGVAESLLLAGQLSEAGLRTLVLAHSPSRIALDTDEPIELPAQLIPVVMLTFREQVRADAAQTLKYFAEQGVGVRVISGDDPRTVAAVAREVGLRDVVGFDARKLPENQEMLAELLEHERVFGRVTPAQKVAMVCALQSRGYVVAMTGDGVNDALAIKKADLGIAMDTAAQATKAVARIVLLDGRFDRMPGVVAEGRRVIANIERVSMLFLTKTSYAFAVAVVFGVLAWSFPFLPRQLSITDGLTIGVPAFFLALMPNTDRYRAGFLKRSLAFSVPSGLIVTAGLIALKILGEQRGPFTLEQMQSASTLTLAGIALWVLAVMARPVSPLRIVIVLAMYAGLALIWLIPLSRDFFRVTWLPEPLGWLVLGIVALGCVLVEVLRMWHLRFARGKGAEAVVDFPTAQDRR